MERKFEKLTLAEVGIIAFMALILLISLGASWYNDSQTVAETSKVSQELVKKDSNYKAAENAVIALEGNPTKEKLKAAQAAVDNLTSTIEKQELQTRIDKVMVAADNLTDDETKARLQQELARAEAARKLETEKNASSASSTSSEVPVEAATGTAMTSEDESYQGEATYRVENTYIAPAQNTYSSPSDTTTYTPSVSQPATTTPETSISTSPEVTEPPVVEIPVTEPSASTETSAESPVTSETPTTSSTDNP